uniref:Ankyrin 3 n=1 Tax=Panthera tigris altaica TaxID=74533 RepID=A0A8C9KI54_PANTA
MTGDTDKYLGPQDLKELGDDSLPAEGYMGFSLGARSASHASSMMAKELTDKTGIVSVVSMFKN